MTQFSVLDLSPIVQGGDAAQSFANSRALAQVAEAEGYRRFWLAEHHNMPGIASAATAVVIGHVAAGTSRIAIGAGGIMLPNHAPLIIAEQFGTLASLYPGRIELGLGRAPGTDQLTARALRRNLTGDVDGFPQDVVELLHYFNPAEPGQRVTAVPGAGLQVPVWILGSSLYGAQLAAALGLPYGFASHFAPDAMMQALEIYRERFQPSQYLQRPYAMVGVNVFAADSHEDAVTLRSSQLQSFLALRSGSPIPLPPPIPDFEAGLGLAERMLLERTLSVSVVGTVPEVRQGLAELIARTGADELMLTGMIYDREARLNSFRLAAEAWRPLQPVAAVAE